MSHECRCGEVDASGLGGARSSAYPMVEVSVAVAAVVDAVSSLQSLRHAFVPLSQCAGLVVAQDRHATEPMPPFPASTMDGYAIISAEGPGVYTVVSQSTAGHSMSPDFALQRGQMVYITTGAPVPNGADAVIPIEWTEQTSEETPALVRTLRAMPAGANIRPVGCDIRVGTTVLHAGQLIGPAEIGVAASLGLAALHVIDRPVVGVLSSGDEICDATPANAVTNELTPAKGEVFDSNRPTLLALAAQAGARVSDLGIVRDDAAELERRVLAALSTVDMLVLSGGVSMGARDFVKPLLAKLGTVHFGRLNMKPGKPTTFAIVRLPGTEVDKLVFGLPGNPVSALVTAQLLLVPAIKCWLRGDAAGVTPRTHGYPVLSVRLATPLGQDAERPEYHRVHMRWDEGADEWVARSTGSQMSSRLLSVCSSNGLVVVPKGQGEVAAGTVVRAMLVGDWNVPDFTAAAAPKVSRRPSASEPAPVASASSAAAAAPVAASVSSAVSSSSSVTAASAAPAPVFELRVAVLTVSDRCASDAATDLSGPAVARLLQSATLKNTRISVVAQECVPDEIDSIQRVIRRWTDGAAGGADAASAASFPQLVLTTGGTGFSPRDITPEAVRGLLDREASGLVFAMMQASMAATPMGALSRPVAGTRARTLILTLPGSPKAVPEILNPILNLLPHAVKLLQSKDDPHTLPSPQPNKSS